MSHAIHRIEAIELAGPHALRLSFADGLQREVDFSSMLAGELYGPLRDEDFFRQVTLDREAHTVVWPNGADFDPATLHDWPDHREAFEELARQWELAETVPQT